MSITGLLQMIEKGTYPPVLMLYGKESYLRDHYARLIRAKAVTQMPELNCSEFSELPYSVETLREAVQTIPFMDDRRLVILRSCQLFATEQNDYAKKLAELIPQIPQTTLLLILEGELTGKSVPKSALFTAISDHGAERAERRPGQNQRLFGRYPQPAAGCAYSPGNRRSAGTNKRPPGRDQHAGGDHPAPVGRTESAL